MVIVNLQKTPKDRKANLIIRSRVDLVMALLMLELGMEVGISVEPNRVNRLTWRRWSRTRLILTIL